MAEFVFVYGSFVLAVSTSAYMGFDRFADALATQPVVRAINRQAFGKQPFLEWGVSDAHTPLPRIMKEWPHTLRPRKGLPICKCLPTAGQTDFR